MTKHFIIAIWNICFIGIILLYLLKFCSFKTIILRNVQLYGVEDLFKRNELYYFFPNPGNLGDMLINMAEYEFFTKLGIQISTRFPQQFNKP